MWRTPKISTRGNRSPGCLRMVARPVIAAPAVLPRAASGSRCSCSCKSTTPAIQIRLGRLAPIWSPSMVRSAAHREPPRSPRLLRPAHHGPRSARPRRCPDIRPDRRGTEAPTGRYTVVNSDHLLPANIASTLKRPLPVTNSTTRPPADCPSWRFRVWLTPGTAVSSPRPAFASSSGCEDWSSSSCHRRRPRFRPASGTARSLHRRRRES